MTDSLPVVGIIGGGQLARMMQSAAIELGLPTKLLAEHADVSAGGVVVGSTVGDYTDLETVRDFADGCDVVTFDHEHVPTGILRDLAAHGVAVRPGPDALVHAQEKAVMRERLTALGVPCPAWRVVADPEALVELGDELGWPVIAKVSRGGYDGKGVWKVDGPEQAEVPFVDKADDVVVVAEEFVPFTRELSVLVARSASGQAVSYPVSESVQTADGICEQTITPAPGLTETQAAELQRLGLTIAAELDVVGILAVELMQRADGSVVVNELAMRPHNTGHWSQDGSVTSQFENHLRAVVDLPLGAPDATAAVTVMHNVLGGDHDGWPAGLDHTMANDPRAKVHWYGKTHRPGRKLGHINVTGDDVAATRARAAAAAAWLRGEDHHGGEGEQA